MDLVEKKVLVTGGAKGIGRCLVDKLIGREATVGVFDVDAEGLEKLMTEHRDIYCLQCDVTDHEQVRESVEKFHQKFGEINVLVNNAGILYSSPLVSLTPEGVRKHDIDTWNRVISTDLSSVFYVTLHVVEKMISKRTKGVIVNISSVCSGGNPGQSAYSAAKAGVNALTATWAKELGLMGIRVVGISPGYTETESTKQAMGEGPLKDVIKRVPLRRLGKPEEIAEGILFLIENDFFNGKVFELDGGLVV